MEKTRLLTIREKKRIFKLRAQGLTLAAIASDIGRSTKAVHQTLKESPIDISGITKAVLREAAKLIGERVDAQYLEDAAARQTSRLLYHSDQLHNVMEEALLIATTQPELFSLINTLRSTLNRGVF